MTSMWGGRFDRPGDPAFRAINASLPVDRRLVQEDVEGSIAWAEALRGAGVLEPQEAARLVEALREIGRQARAAPESLRDAPEEDVHTWVEARLIERTGDLGRKLHTGRSRNDQVATDLRLWLRRQAAQRRREILDAQDALLRLAERNRDTVIPGYTHLQPAQPVLFAHWCLAYVEMLQRDDERLAAAASRAALCPLGSGALAGTTYPVDREALARALRFAGPTANSLDAVSDRDFAAETVFAAALCSVHLSRLAEDVIFYGSAEAGFVELDDSTSSGSSLLPQKKNPDALELLRGKAGRLLGDLVALGTTLKGLPLAYNKDLQEDKVPLFDAMDTLSACLKVLPPVLDGLTVRADRCREAALRGHANATDLADYLVARGVPFREAHERAGRLVRLALERGCGLEELPLEPMQAVAPQVGPEVRDWLRLERVLERRDCFGGTAPARVEEGLRRARARLEAARREAGEPAGEVRRARIDDVDAICRIVDYWAQRGENLPRPRQQVIEAIADFGVAETDGRIVGCGSLYVYTSTLAEIRSLGVDPDCHGGGIGTKLVRYFIDCAQTLRIGQVFVLTRAPGFFEKLGFRVEPIASFPEKVWKDCVTCTRRECCDETPMVYEVVS